MADTVTVDREWLREVMDDARRWRDHRRSCLPEGVPIGRDVQRSFTDALAAQLNTESREGD